MKITADKQPYWWVWMMLGWILTSWSDTQERRSSLFHNFHFPICSLDSNTYPSDPYVLHKHHYDWLSIRRDVAKTIQFSENFRGAVLAPVAVSDPTGALLELCHCFHSLLHPMALSGSNLWSSFLRESSKLSHSRGSTCSHSCRRWMQLQETTIDQHLLSCSRRSRKPNILKRHSCFI